LPLKVYIVFGTRPEAIKMAPVCHELLRDSKNFDVTICVTAQHREMLDQVLDIFGIIPDIDLNLMKSGQDLSEITTSILSEMRKLFKKNKPDLVLVHGDTTTSFATALAAFYEKIEIGHVEAGLRTYDIHAPYPEEFNRQIISKIANYHFAPTKTSQDNLVKEGVSKKNIFVTGNTVIDSLFWITKKSKNYIKSIEADISKKLNFDLLKSKYILITGHRRENFGDGFINICKSLTNLANNFSEINFVYPVHLNPNVQDPVKKYLSNVRNIFLIDPLEYEHFVHLLQNSYIVLTDSGGIQEEAPSFGKPVLVMREVTERPEAVKAGTVKLVGSNQSNIEKSISKLILDENEYKKMSLAHNPYGDGKSSSKIANVLKKKLVSTHV
jgi:UDP-N-acetylglucosamine 2-epimerase (non-hydrolysing)